jgi:hypothetical protein
MSLSIGQCFGQKKDSTWVGVIRGIIWDSEHNTVLRAATVAIYLAGDSTLIGYRLTNNYGEFDYKGLPCDIPLKLIASYVGYKSSVKKFSIPSAKKDLDIGHVDLTFVTNELKEVVVSSTPPPVQMKGDTLEFNADAFKLDPNAQTEDLLRVLPGITIWADGAITVNGREIKSVLVNGKPFFGGDARIATQNIPKNVVDKIQVYQKDKDPKKLTDSTSEINIKLKKGKGVGYFGKFSGGYGTGGHYEGDGNMNFFDGRTQLGLALSSNNVNKVANDINFILRNNTFKGNGANVEYQSNFEIEGVNKFTAGGVIFQHDFIDNPNYYNNNRITALYFIKHNQQNLVQNTQTITTLNDGLFFKQQNVNRSDNTQESQNASANYEKIIDGNKFSAEGNFRNEVTNSQMQNQSEISDQNSELLSTNRIFNKTANRLNDFNFKTTYTHKIIDQDRSWLSRYDLGYNLNVTDDQADNSYKSIYIPAANPEGKINFDRLYNNGVNTLSNNLTLNLPNFGALIFGDYKLAGIATGLQSNLQITTNKIHSDVKDRDTTSNQYLVNPYLTNNRSETVLNMKPTLTFTKKIYRDLSNRYEKDFSATVNMGVQFYGLNNTSEKLFQQFSRSYQKFIPSVDINFLNRQFGEFTNSIALQINTSSQYPTIQQLAPLVDSVNLNFIQKGNLHLKEQDTRELTFTFRHISERSANILTWSTSLRAGYIKNYFTSSSVIDNLGRTVYTTVNADGYRYMSGSAELKKAFKWTNNQIQFSVTPVASIDRSPNYINGVFSYFNNFSLSYNPGINYTYKNWLDVNIVEKQSYNRYTQNRADAVNLSNLISQSAVSLNINCTSKLTIGSNATYTKNSYNGAEVKNFTIWNASVNYKFLKGNVAEIKLSALDILHQNTGLTNYGFNNSITQGSVNILQQYFMLGFAYYPRKFGK